VVSWVGVLSAGLTTLCCLGVSAALSLATALGATFLTRDGTLRPILGGTLAVTIAGSALTYRRHRRPAPLALTTLAAVWVYAKCSSSTAVMVATPTPDTAITWSNTPPSMLATASPVAASPSCGSGSEPFVGAQVWDLVRVRRGQREVSIECAP
jgi:hypothetical protein